MNFKRIVCWLTRHSYVRVLSNIHPNKTSITFADNGEMITTTDINAKNIQVLPCLYCGKKYETK